MKNILFKVFFSLFLLVSFLLKAHAQVESRPVKMSAIGYPWKGSELLEPATLADILKSGNEKITILNIGAVRDLPGAVHIGAVSNQQNMEKLQQALTVLPKNQPLIIYCGCCPFTKCPNIEPAYEELKKAGFTQIKILDLPTNLKTNWISKGYPLAK